MQVDIVRPSDGPLEHLITPFFTHMNLENVPQSRIKGEYVSDIVEVVQLRFAGDKNYSPVMRVHDVYSSDGINAVTYAERFATQYRAFLQGDAQLADGTPLEKLVSYGVTPAHLSLCRSLKIHSIEALANLEGANLKNSGSVVTNVIKPMAKKYMEDRGNGTESHREIEALRAELAALKAGSVVVPEVQATPEEIAAAEKAVEDETQERETLKAEYADLTGARPRGNPSIETLRAMVKEAKG